MAAWLDKEGKPLEFEWQGRGTKLYVVNNKKNYYPTIQFTAHGMGGKSRCQLANKEWITRLWAVGKDAFLQALQAKGPPNPQKQQDHAMLKAFMEAIVAAEQANGTVASVEGGMEQGSDVEEAASLEEEEAVDGAMEEAVEEAPTQDEGNEDLSPRKLLDLLVGMLHSKCTMQKSGFLASLVDQEWLSIRKPFWSLWTRSSSYARLVEPSDRMSRLAHMAGMTEDRMAKACLNIAIPFLITELGSATFRETLSIGFFIIPSVFRVEMDLPMYGTTALLRPMDLPHIGTAAHITRSARDGDAIVMVLCLGDSVGCDGDASTISMAVPIMLFYPRDDSALVALPPPMPYQSFLDRLHSAAVFTYENFYKHKHKDTHLNVHPADCGIERPNHALSNAIRKACLVPAIAAAYLQEYNEKRCSRQSFAFSAEEQCCMMVAMLFESTCRESEEGGKKFADLTRGYKENSVAAFVSFATPHFPTLVQDVADALMCMYELFDGDGSPSDLSKSKGDVAIARGRINAKDDVGKEVIQAMSLVLEVAHDLDLFRCTGDKQMQPKLDRIAADTSDKACVNLSCHALDQLHETGDLICSAHHLWTGMKKDKREPWFKNENTPPFYLGHMLQRQVFEVLKDLVYTPTSVPVETNDVRPKASYLHRWPLPPSVLPALPSLETIAAGGSTSRHITLRPVFYRNLSKAPPPTPAGAISPPSSKPNKSGDSTEGDFEDMILSSNAHSANALFIFNENVLESKDSSPGGGNAAIRGEKMAVGVPTGWSSRTQGFQSLDADTTRAIDWGIWSVLRELYDNPQIQTVYYSCSAQCAKKVGFDIFTPGQAVIDYLSDRIQQLPHLIVWLEDARNSCPIRNLLDQERNALIRFVKPPTLSPPNLGGGINVAGIQCDPPPIQYPSEWKDASPDPAALSLRAGDTLFLSAEEEADFVSRKFKESLPDAEVIQVWSLQHRDAWERFWLERHKFGGEAWLWHSSSRIDPLLRLGSDYPFSADHIEKGGSYGNGFYFAQHALYSDQVVPCRVSELKPPGQGTPQVGDDILLGPKLNSRRQDDPHVVYNVQSVYQDGTCKLKSLRWNEDDKAVTIRERLGAEGCRKWYDADDKFIFLSRVCLGNPKDFGRRCDDELEDMKGYKLPEGYHSWTATEGHLYETHLPGRSKFPEYEIDAKAALDKGGIYGRQYVIGANGNSRIYPGYLVRYINRRSRPSNEPQTARKAGGKRKKPPSEHGDSDDNAGGDPVSEK